MMWNDAKGTKEGFRTLDIVRRLKLMDLKKEITKDLAVCPFCGCDINKEATGWATIEKWHIKSDTYRIICPKCGGAGPDAATIEWAALLWNERADDERD